LSDLLTLSTTTPIQLISKQKRERMKLSITKAEFLRGLGRIQSIV